LVNASAVTVVTTVVEYVVLSREHVLPSMCSWDSIASDCFICFAITAIAYAIIHTSQQQRLLVVVAEP